MYRINPCRQMVSDDCLKSIRDFDRLAENENFLYAATNACDYSSNPSTYSNACEKLLKQLPCGDWRSNWDDLNSSQCLKAIDAFKKFQTTLPEYIAIHQQCNPYVHWHDCLKAGIRKIETCADAPLTKECKAAQTAFDQFAIKRSEPRNEYQNFGNPAGINFDDLWENLQKLLDSKFGGNFGEGNNAPPSETGLGIEDKSFGRNLLGLKGEYTQKECNKAFKMYAVKHHPDKYSDVKSAEENKATYAKLSAMIDELCANNK